MQWEQCYIVKVTMGGRGLSHTLHTLSHNATQGLDCWAARCGEMRSPFCVINLPSWRNSVHSCLCTRRSSAHYFISQPPLIILPVLHSSFRHVLCHISLLTFLPLSRSASLCLSLSIRSRLELRPGTDSWAQKSLWEKLEELRGPSFVKSSFNLCWLHTWPFYFCLSGYWYVSTSNNNAWLSNSHRLQWQHNATQYSCFLCFHSSVSTFWHFYYL